MNTPATVAPDEMVTIGKDVPDEPAEMEEAPGITIPVLSVCFLAQRERRATRLMSVLMPDDRARIFSPGCLTA